MLEDSSHHHLGQNLMSQLRHAWFIASGEVSKNSKKHWLW